MLPTQRSSRKGLVDVPRVAAALRDLDAVCVHYHAVKSDSMPYQSRQHRLGGPIPQIIIYPRSEFGVRTALHALHKHGIYELSHVSVKAGGHSYANESACDGIMIDVSLMMGIAPSSCLGTISFEPGCSLGKLAHTLSTIGRAVPHGDCLGVGAGGHFLTAGADMLLSRRYGLGCQNLLSARVVLWDGDVLDVTQESHPDLLWALKGGAAGKVGVVTKCTLKLYEAPTNIVMCQCFMTREQLDEVARLSILSVALKLPTDFSMCLRLGYYDSPEPSWCLRLCCLRSEAEAKLELGSVLPEYVFKMLLAQGTWTPYESVRDFRLQGCTDFVKNAPEMFQELSCADILHLEEKIWKPSLLWGEMKQSFLEERSTWVSDEGSRVLVDMADALADGTPPSIQNNVFAGVFVLGGATRQMESSMPFGNVLVRFEGKCFHDNLHLKQIKLLADGMYKIMQRHQGERETQLRPFRGDVWSDEQVDSPEPFGGSMSWDSPRRGSLEGRESRMRSVMAQYMKIDDRGCLVRSSSRMSSRGPAPSKTACMCCLQ